MQLNILPEFLNSLENPYDNVFYNTWVKDISLDRLLALEQDEKTAFSLFSSNAIETIADDYITGKFRPKMPYRELGGENLVPEINWYFDGTVQEQLRSDDTGVTAVRRGLGAG